MCVSLCVYVCVRGMLVSGPPKAARRSGRTEQEDGGRLSSVVAWPCPSKPSARERRSVSSSGSPYLVLIAPRLPPARYSSPAKVKVSGRPGLVPSDPSCPHAAPGLWRLPREAPGADLEAVWRDNRAACTPWNAESRAPADVY